MKDIDFDELDRAVSSVLGQKAPSAEEKKHAETGAAASATASDATVPTDDTPASDTPAAADAPTEVPAEKPQRPASTPLAIKRRGKFMDVMHPSADMQPGASASAPKPHRAAPIVTPLLPEETDSSETPTAEPTAALDESGALIGAEPAPAEPDVAVVAEDKTGTSTEESAPAVSPDEQLDQLRLESETADSSDTVLDGGTEQESDSEAEEAAESSEQSQAPSTDGDKPTPFLSDTQVEKRPLGAFGENDTTQVDGIADDLTPSADADLQPAATPAALPRELQPDVVNVESVHEAEAEQAAAANVDAAPGSMPFAAKVPVAPEATDGRVEGHPLFDTSTYHEPIAAVHSRGLPGWAKWTIGLLICLAIGAGVGYFLFTAGL